MPDPHDHYAAQVAWVLRPTDHDDREAFMAGWDAAVTNERARIKAGVEGLLHDDYCSARPWAPIGPCDCHRAAVLRIVEGERVDPLA